MIQTEYKPTGLCIISRTIAIINIIFCCFAMCAFIFYLLALSANCTVCRNYKSCVDYCKNYAQMSTRDKPYHWISNAVWSIMCIIMFKFNYALSCCTGKSNIYVIKNWLKMHKIILVFIFVFYVVPELTKTAFGKSNHLFFLDLFLFVIAMVETFIVHKFHKEVVLHWTYEFEVEWKCTNA